MRRRSGYFVELRVSALHSDGYSGELGGRRMTDLRESVPGGKVNDQEYHGASLLAGLRKVPAPLEVCVTCVPDGERQAGLLSADV